MQQYGGARRRKKPFNFSPKILFWIRIDKIKIMNYNNNVGKKTNNNRRVEKMNKTTNINGYEVNCQYSKDGSTLQRAFVRLNDTAPGMRANDGDSARAARKEIKLAVAEALGLPREKVRILARYSCLRQNPDGTISRLDSAGHVIGTHMK